MRPVLYISGPLTQGSRGQNLGNALHALQRCIELGYAPICPHLTMMAPFDGQFDYEVWMEIDFAHIKASAAVLRIDGHSPGGDREVAFAEKNNIPVYYGLDNLPLLTQVNNIRNVSVVPNENWAEPQVFSNEWYHGDEEGM